MPKKKHRPGSGAARSPRPRAAQAPRAGRAARESAALLREFEEFARGLDLFIEDSTGLVRTALRLKAERLGSPDPTAWTAEEIRTVLTGLLPHEPLDAAARRLLVPTVTLYFGFLGRTGRWSSPLDEDALTVLMEEMAREVPAAFAAHDAEPAQRTEPTAEPAEPAVEPAEPTADPTTDPTTDPSDLTDEPAATGGMFGPDVWPVALGPVPDPGVLRPDLSVPGQESVVGHVAVLRAVLQRPGSPRLAAVLLGAVLRAAGPGGLTLPGPHDTEATSGGEDVVAEVAAALRTLEEAGVVDRDGATYRLPAERHAVVGLTLELLQADR